MKLMSPVVVLVAMCFLELATAYPTMVPSDACDKMRPGHHENKTWSMPLIEPQWGDPYFSIHVNPTGDIMPGDSVTVTIHADEHYFEGFLIQAHEQYTSVWDIDTPTRHGSFSTYMPDTQLACYGQAVSHNTHKHYDRAEFMWTAPNVEKATGIQFTATIVKGYTTFFMNVKSDPIMVVPYNSNSAPTSFTPGTTSLFILVAIATFIFKQI